MCGKFFLLLCHSLLIAFLKKFFIYLFIFGCVGSSLWCAGFSLQWLSSCGARSLGARASAVAARGPSSCGLLAPEHRLSSCGIRA